jgi:hypothetical protein
MDRHGKFLPRMCCWLAATDADVTVADGNNLGLLPAELPPLFLTGGFGETLPVLFPSLSFVVLNGSTIGT